MAEWSLVFSLMVVCALGVGAGFTGKGFYCRDPDTGKLYPVNTTWPSTTFCGSYTCKLRRKNVTEPGTATLLRRVNITKHIDHATNINNNEINLAADAKTNSEQNLNTVKMENKARSQINHEEKYSDLLLNEENVRNIIRQKIKNNEGKHDGDRYLTENEIKSLTDLLHTIKKSDLEAIIEMYTLAQDVYKEIDTTTDENLIEETLKDMKESKRLKDNEIPEDMANKKYTSYWYEPLAGSLHKQKIGETDTNKEMAEPLDVLKVGPKDMQHDGSDASPVTVVRPTNNLPYFTGPLTNDDFRKLPYYYPMSSFQRLSSYYHPQKYVNMGNIAQEIMVIPTLSQNIIAQNNKPIILQNDKSQNTETENNSKKHALQSSILHNIIQQINTPKDKKTKKPCKSAIGNLKYLHIQPSWVNRIVKKPFNIESHRKNKRFQDEVEKKSRPVAMIDNESNTNIWKFMDLYNKRYNAHIPNYVGTAYIARIPHAVLVNSEVVKDKKENEVKPKSIIEENEEKMPDWQTNPLSKSVLEEVKANVGSRPKLFPHPLRKHVKLERVGKVIKLEEFVRPKREASYKDETKEKNSVELSDLYEVYVHKSMCDTDTEPGFFRMGNLTEPYPACCPQRIGKNR